jgi:hypothetical protein
LPNKHNPFLWFSVEEGLLVLSQNQTSQQSPLALHFIPSYRFEITGQLITQDCPPYPTWIQQPLVSKQGFFLATETELQYFPTHGYEKIFEPQSWQPPAGYQIHAIALDNEGQPLILVSDDNQKMQLFFGNVQSGQWGESKIDLDKTANNNSGYSIAVGKAVPKLCAIYDGQELLLVDIENLSVQQNVRLNDALIRPDSLFHRRAQTAYFEPFLIGTQGDSLRCIIPVNSRNDKKPRQAGVVRFGSNNTTPIKTQQFQLDSWILPDPWGLGFMIWSDQAVQRYEGPQVSWDEEGGNFSLVQPLQTPHWFVGQASLSRGRREEDTEIIIISASKENDRYNLRLRNRPTLQNVRGTKVAGMPPIQSNGRLFIALRETNNETASVIVYTMQIA